MKRRSSARTGLGFATGGALGRRRRGGVDRLRRVDDAVAVRAGLDRVGLLQGDRELGRDVPVTALARHPDDRRDGDTRASPLDVLVLREQPRVDLLHRLLAAHPERAELLVGGGLLPIDLLDPGLGGRFALGELLLPRLEGLRDLAGLGGELADLLRLPVVRLLGDVDLAGKGGVLAGGADLAEAPLPLLHLVPLHREEGLELAPLPLVRVEPDLLLLPGLLGHTHRSLDLRPPGGEDREGPLDLVHLQIDSLELLQRLQLLTQRQGNSSLETWAHQDSNLDLIGYEPTALAVELWALRRYPARLPVSHSPSSRRSS